ncbi:Lamina-associated polypeptide 2, isoforms beta/gamma [Triplophysa tibetana]|uniref:Lamina-associated polypeptide 2, isoforms beta/gamma n=1 Tax=Triplophysa tibetana TaxID=1572043 RepID=A0A5A9PR67_9TELE|nr:Lamina-associated polypeptide 2, isoforms beta/gamma [Triplophysa tibetana]
MAQFHEDPAVLTKEKLKSELIANNVPLPSADSKKDVYVQLYLKNLTVLNKTRASPPADTFSSDDEDSSRVTGKKSMGATAVRLPTFFKISSFVFCGRKKNAQKAIRKTDRAPEDEKDVSSLTDEELNVQLQKYGVHTGPIVASTRKLYEKKLQQFLDQPLVETTLPETAIPEAVTIKADGNQNGNTPSYEDHYSDKEDDSVPEPVPVASKPVRSRGKAPVTTRTGSRQRAKVQMEETTAAGLRKTSGDGGDALKEMFPNEPRTPTGMMATCRKPIHGAAGRPVKPLNLWSEEPVLQQVYTATKSSLSEVRSATPAPPPSRWFSFWLKVLLVLTLAVCLYYAFQNVTADQIDTCQVFVQDNVITPLVNYMRRDSRVGK